MTTESTIYTYPMPPTPAIAPRACMLAFVASLVIFVMLPLFGLSSQSTRDELTLSPAALIEHPPPPPPERKRELPPEKPEEKPDIPEPDAPKPEPRPIEMKPPKLQLPMSTLDLSMGDFALDFQTAPVAVDPPPDPGARVNVFGLGELDERPRPISVFRPTYPLAARRQKRDGYVDVEFLILPTGETANAVALRSEPGNTFTEAALQAVRRWRFTPSKRNGKAVRVRVRQTIRFELED